MMRQQKGSRGGRLKERSVHLQFKHTGNNMFGINRGNSQRRNFNFNDF